MILGTVWAVAVLMISFGVPSPTHSDSTVARSGNATHAQFQDSAYVPSESRCASAICGAARIAGITNPLSTVAARPDALGNTPTNSLVANWSGEGMIAENPSNPLNLVAGSLYQAPSSYNDSTTYYQSGVSGAFTSFDGGRTWVDQTLPQYPAWANKSSPLCGMIHLADSALAFGPNNTAYYADLSYPANTSSCTSAGGGLGLYVTTSKDGGVSWETPVPPHGNVTTDIDKPWIAVDPTSGEVYVAYTDDGSGSQIFIQNSTDRGKHWSSPLDISKGTDSMRGVELAVDPWGGVDAFWVDQSVPSPLYFTRSSNHGESFSTPKIVATGPSWSASPSPDSFRAYLIPGLGVDAYTSNPYEGRLFTVWQNGTGGGTGSPKISLSYSSNNGSSWSAPITVNSDTKFEDFQPDVAVGPDGTVYVEWYAVNYSSGHYRLLGAVSHNGGKSFGQEFSVSDTDSYPSYPSGLAAWWIGDYTDIIADASGARPLWTDARATQEWNCSPCLWGYDYNISMYTAEIVNFSLTATVPTNVTVNGTVPTHGNVTLGPGVSAYGDWLVGQTYSIQAPTTAIVNGTPHYFALWFSKTGWQSGRYLNGTVAGSTTWNACYAATRAGTCQAPGAPGYLNVTAVPATAQVTIDGRATPLVNGTAQMALSTGSYWVNASLQNYHPSVQKVNVTPGNISRVTVTLVPYPGTIRGVILPVQSNVTVDGTRVIVSPSGAFSATVQPGTHRVAASKYGYAPYSNTAVSVGPNGTTNITINLVPEFGRITGTVDPSGASVTINGTPVNVTSGSFSLSLIQGTYWVNATASGYLPYASGPISLAPLQTIPLTIILVQPTGYLVGTVTPSYATLLVNGSAVLVNRGVFNATFIDGVYVLNASAPGYIPTSIPFTISYAASTPLHIQLSTAPGWVSGTVTPATASLSLDGTRVTLSASGTFNVSTTVGIHQLRTTASGYVPDTRSVIVGGGATSQVVILLSPSPVVTGTMSSIPSLVAGSLVVATAVIAAALILIRRRNRA